MTLDNQPVPGGDIITTEDINHRVRAFCMTTGIPYNRQTKLLIINKVMQNTIDEKLKAQEVPGLCNTGRDNRLRLEVGDTAECDLSLFRGYDASSGK